jgi:hypothetical protein
LQLVDTRTFSSGVTVLTYRPADRVPSSRYVEMFAWTQEQLRSWQAAQNADRVLATVLFTDIVGSTEQLASHSQRIAVIAKLTCRHVFGASLDRTRVSFAALGSGDTSQSWAHISMRMRRSPTTSEFLHPTGRRRSTMECQ